MLLQLQTSIAALPMSVLYQNQTLIGVADPREMNLRATSKRNGPRELDMDCVSAAERQSSMPPLVRTGFVKSILGTGFAGFWRFGI